MNKEEELIALQYEKLLVIPERKPSPQFMLCPVGLVGAGKTTVVKPLSEILSLVRISSDELRKLFKENGFGYEHVFKVVTTIAEKYLGLGYSIGIDADCASLHGREFISKAEKKFGVFPVWIHINPPEEFIINKLKNFKHTWLFENGDQAIENYKQRKSLHENLDMPFICTFDTSAKDISDQIDMVFQLIKEKFKITV